MVKYDRLGQFPGHEGTLQPFAQILQVYWVFIRPQPSYTSRNDEVSQMPGTVFCARGRG